MTGMFFRPNPYTVFHGDSSGDGLLVVVDVIC